MNSGKKKILVRLPNWLGDLVMSSAFMSQLRDWEEDAIIEVITRKHLVPLAECIPGINKVHGFSKEDFSGMGGVTRFGRQFKDGKYDLFFCLPDSFSSATMAAATGAKERIGHRKEMRGFLLTKSYRKPEGKHRVDEYLNLLTSYYKRPVIANSVTLKSKAKLPSLFPDPGGKPIIVCNFNSEAQSRRVPVTKAAAIVISLRTAIDAHYVLIGGPKELEHTNAIAQLAGDVINMAGLTTLDELATMLANADLTVTTDSGPAHLCNALGSSTLVFFGAGDPHNTAPWNPDKRTILLGETACTCKLSNQCTQDEPPCLNSLSNHKIVEAAQQLLRR